MIYLSGHIAETLRTVPSAGYMLSASKGKRPDVAGIAWAADNGCFATPHLFDLAAYLCWLSGYGESARRTCLFATAPDVLGDAAATWTRSRNVLPVLRALGYPAALVAQDGVERTRIAWETFDVLFVGGSTAWKLSEAAYALVREAKARGKGTHMGRVNSLRRLRAAQVGGYDSVDGTFLAFGPTVNRARLLRWLDIVNMQKPLEAA